MKLSVLPHLALTLSFALGSVGLSPALAEPAYPVKPISMIIPQGPGGGSDTLGRYVAERVGKILNQPIVVENRPGAAGVLGAEAVKRSPPDGYTMLLGAIDTITAPLVNPATTLNAATDFEPISQLAQSPNVWVLSPGFEGKTMRDLVRIAGERPNQIDFASSGVGSMQHLGGELLNQMAGIQLSHVPYKGGPAGFSDVIGGRVPSMVSGFQGALAQVSSGNVVAVAITDTKRWDAMKDVPTVAEALDLPEYVAMNWQGLFFPVGTPKERVDIVADAVRQLMSDPTVQKTLAELGYEPIGNTPDEFRKVISAEHEKWTQLIEKAGIQVQ